MQSLCFFDKEGHYINMKYDSVSETYTGDLIFHENGSDTFKTIGLYTFEKIPSFEFESKDLSLEKFQLFNEYGVNITGNSYMTQSVIAIEPVNNDPSFYSKWIYGVDFEKKFPIGSEISFNTPIFEFSNPLDTHTVVSSKKGAIMILSNIDNRTFNINYELLIGLTSSYENVTISGLNTIGIKNYINYSTLLNNLSSWSEPYFYDMLYNGRKLNLVNTEKNDSIVTIKNKDILDKIYFNYHVDSNSLPYLSTLIMEVVLKTDLPIIYKGGLNFVNNRVVFYQPVPKVLKPGIQLSVDGSINNSGILTIDSIPTFLGNTQLTYYTQGSQVVWNNLIYECLQSYTQSATSSVSPDNIDYWTSNITYIPVVESLTNETLLYGEVYLTSNKFYFGVSGSSSSELTLAFAAEKYKSDLSTFNIDLYYDNRILHADSIYASEYAIVNFYIDSISTSNLIGGKSKEYEKVIETREELKSELNSDISSRWKYNIVFTDIDEYGIIIDINGMIYQQEVEWVYSGLDVDLVRTVDKTLRAWLNKHFLTLYRLGISANLDYLVNYPYIYFDSVTLRSIYPNVPLNFKVTVGTTANFYIQHSDVTFYEIGNALTFTINNRVYSVPFDTDVSTTLLNWMDLYSDLLVDYGIYTSVKNTTLFFDVKEYDQVLDYSISIGKSILPGQNSFKVVKKMSGNLGCLVASNATILSGTQSVTFYDVNGPLVGDTSFATGMITSINNTIYPFDNQEYNIIEVNPTRLVLSYQGPFWGGTAISKTSPYVDAAFNDGFTQSLQISATTSTILPGAYNSSDFDFSFDVNRGNGLNYYYNFYNGVNNMVDIVYINSLECFYVLGDRLYVYDGLSGDYIDEVTISGISGSLKLLYNNIDGYLYVFCQTNFHKVDPETNLLINSYSYSVPYIPYDFIVNDLNGDIYISYQQYTYVEVLTVGGSTIGITGSIGLTYGTAKMAYNQFENDIYVNTSDENTVLRIDGSSRSLFTSYNVPGLDPNTIIYEPINSSIYVIGDYLSQINNGVITSISSIVGDSFNDIIYNNINQSIYVCRSNSFSNIKIDNTIIYDNVSNGSYGLMSLNQYDERLYLSGPGYIYIFNASQGSIEFTINTLYNPTKLIYNPLRKSMWGLLPDDNKIIEVVSIVPINIVIYQPSYNGIYDSQYGTLAQGYTDRDNIWLKTRDYIRRPRENFEGETQVQYIWKWLTDDKPQIFMYDFSGSQLPTTGAYAYIGEKPLKNINLNKHPNKDISKTASSAYQQTIFSEISNNLEYVNSSTDLSYTPEPLELFLGFNSQDEGVVFSTLLLVKRESVNFSIKTDNLNFNIISFESILETSTGKFKGYISLDSNSTENFLHDIYDVNRGLKVGQIIQIFVKDNTPGTKNKYISYNNGLKLKITELYLKSIIGDFVGPTFSSERTVISDYPTSGKTTYLTTTFKVSDKEIGRFNISGQTEIEDIRYKTELTNMGKNITADDVFIFKTYDINEEGVDWNYLNLKRKEMLMVKNDIYPYIGAYKSIINAINYFGYNDLELYEYYRNINIDSTDYGKLYKIEIPDIFDNTVEGWKENDFIKHTMPNPNYETTNLFNLTYRITDRDGNNVLLYSLPEVLIKLQGLKHWLQRNIIPLSHKILDITGRADFPAPNSIVHKSYDAKILNVKQSLSPIDFDMNEAYLMPVNSGSTVYNVVLDFKNQSLDIATKYFSVNEIPDYFELKIRTYKTYPEWRPFRTYKTGDIVSYYQQNYESVYVDSFGRDDNRLRDPRKYQDSPTWSINVDYKQGDIVEYKRNFYEFIGTQSAFVNGTSSVKTPFIDVLNSNGYWIDITEWRKIDYSPVQTIHEFRSATHSFHFTVDTNIDPFITVEVTSDNGYGQIYTSKKNYELRSILDINEDIGELDEIGPVKVYPFLTSTTTSTTTIPDQIIEIWEPIDSYCEDININPPTTTTTSTTTTTTTTITQCNSYTITNISSSRLNIVYNLCDNGGPASIRQLGTGLSVTICTIDTFVNTSRYTAVLNGPCVSGDCTLIGVATEVGSMITTSTTTTTTTNSCQTPTNVVVTKEMVTRTLYNYTGTWDDMGVVDYMLELYSPSMFLVGTASTSNTYYTSINYNFDISNYTVKIYSHCGGGVYSTPFVVTLP